MTRQKTRFIEFTCDDYQDGLVHINPERVSHVGKGMFGTKICFSERKEDYLVVKEPVDEVVDRLSKENP